MAEKNGQADPCTIVIFGASGDLTSRKLMPALHSLSCEGLLHPQTDVIGLALTDLSQSLERASLNTTTIPSQEQANDASATLRIGKIRRALRPPRQSARP